MPLSLSRLARFSSQIVKWQELHGRHDLPWQNTQQPYKVWLSEIMLQQTQVITVLGYFNRFLERFPTVASLAEAQVDDVLGLWSGLGYYSRARNLHRCAQNVVTLHGGEFPRTAAELQSLPGIGPSTAAAIASFCYLERAAILDSNVKRVLTRVLAFKEDISESANDKTLWSIANSLLPKQGLAHTMPRYSQGLMDLGATVCTSRKPACGICPVQRMCDGLVEGDPGRYPVKNKKLKRSSIQLWLLLARMPSGAVWLAKRPNNGIWGGLYCLPVYESEEALFNVAPEVIKNKIEVLPPFKHMLTHRDLRLTPLSVELSSSENSSFDSLGLCGRWYMPQEYLALGLPAPIRKLLHTQPG